MPQAYDPVTSRISNITTAQWPTSRSVGAKNSWLGSFPPAIATDWCRPLAAIAIHETNT